MNKQIILASNNKGKIQEFKDYLKQFDIDVISQKEAGCNIDVEENGTTYEENALIKAKAKEGKNSSTSRIGFPVLKT